MAQEYACPAKPSGMLSQKKTIFTFMAHTKKAEVVFRSLLEEHG